MAAVRHGFRSSFCDWAADRDAPNAVTEATLSHVVRHEVEAAYGRTDLFERRRRLMDDWAAYLAGRARQLTGQGRGRWRSGPLCRDDR